MRCPYCKAEAEAELKDSKVIYGKSYGLVWICSRYPQCDVYVGCHKGTETPLGTMAGKELRELRKEAHAVFDRLWKDGNITRGIAYTPLRGIMKLDEDQAHIGQFNERQCKELIEYFKPRMGASL